MEVTCILDLAIGKTDAGSRKQRAEFKSDLDGGNTKGKDDYHSGELHLDKDWSNSVQVIWVDCGTTEGTFGCRF